MTHQQIDHRLVLAIGWHEDQMMRNAFGDVFLLRYGLGGKYWKFFDHTDPVVIWPIAERFDAFPVRNTAYGTVKLWGTRLDRFGTEHNPATASALAVIEYVEGKA